MVTINQLVDIVEDIAGLQLERHYDLTAPKGVRGRNSDNTMILHAARLGTVHHPPHRTREDLRLDLRSDRRADRNPLVRVALRVATVPDEDRVHRQDPAGCALAKEWVNVDEFEAEVRCPVDHAPEGRLVPRRRGRWTARIQGRRSWTECLARRR